MAISNAAISVPRTEPMPPTTITTSARISTGSPMPDCTDRIGPASAPATPASTDPSRNSSVFSRSTLAPSTLAMGALLAPARISMPKRVRWIRNHAPTATRAPIPMIISR
ncbi:hypothetical protein D3C72_1242000 [compost metagenome]